MYSSRYSPYGLGAAARGQRRQLSRRNVRGAGWHKRGYRDNGDMWINVRMGSYGHTRGQDVNEKLTIAEFWRQVVSGVEMEDGFPLPEDWDIDLESRKKSIDGTSDELITTLFDGGETVYAKVYDADGRKRVWDGISWTYHSPGRR